jgi:hypothetical protein
VYLAMAPSRERDSQSRCIRTAEIGISTELSTELSAVHHV